MSDTPPVAFHHGKDQILTVDPQTALQILEIVNSTNATIDWHHTTVEHEPEYFRLSQQYVSYESDGDDMVATIGVKAS